MLDSFLIDKLSIKIYEKQIFSFDFIQFVSICLGFLFSQPKTYISIILKAVKGCTSVKQSFVHANCDRRQNLP